MRSFVASVFLTGFLVHSVTADATPCIEDKLLGQSNRCYSGQFDKLKSCVREILDDVTQTNLDDCLEQAGCEQLDAKFEAQWIIESCFEGQELRRRQEDEENDDEEDQTTPTQTTAETVAATSSADASPQDTTAVATTTTAITATAAAATTSLQCYTTITFTTEGFDIINTDSSGRVSRSFNSQKVGIKTRCADGLVCSGESCMEAENGLDGSGVAVAIFFGAAAAVAFGTVIFLCCRDRRNDKKLRAKAEAAKIAKEQAAASKPAASVTAGMRSVSQGRRSPSGNDRSPLMNQGMYPPSPGGSARPSHDPFGESGRRV